MGLDSFHRYANTIDTGNAGSGITYRCRVVRRTRLVCRSISRGRRGWCLIDI